MFTVKKRKHARWHYSDGQPYGMGCCCSCTRTPDSVPGSGSDRESFVPETHSTHASSQNTRTLLACNCGNRQDHPSCFIPTEGEVKVPYKSCMTALYSAFVQGTVLYFVYQLKFMYRPNIRNFDRCDIFSHAAC